MSAGRVAVGHGPTASAAEGDGAGDGKSGEEVQAGGTETKVPGDAEGAEKTEANVPGDAEGAEETKANVPGEDARGAEETKANVPGEDAGGAEKTKGAEAADDSDEVSGGRKWATLRRYLSTHTDTHQLLDLEVIVDELVASKGSHMLQPEDLKGMSSADLIETWCERTGGK